MKEFNYEEAMAVIKTKNVEQIEKYFGLKIDDLIAVIKEARRMKTR